MTRVESDMVTAGRHRAYEFASQVPLGLICELPNGAGWWSSFLSGRDDAISAPFKTIEAARVELGRWADRNPAEMARLHRELIAARARATSPEPVEMPAPVQGGMLI